MTQTANVTPDQVAIALASALRVGHGYQSCVAASLNWPRQRVSEMLSGANVSPFEQVRRVVETLRNNGNALADEPFLALSRELGFVSYRHERAEASDAACLVSTMREMADVVEAHALANDGEHDEEDALALVTQLHELQEAAAAFADRLESQLRKSAPRRVAAWTVRG